MIIVLFGLVVSPVWGSDASIPESERILVGIYTNYDNSGPIRGVFSSTGVEEGVPTWSVVFTVTFDTADYTYQGVAEGSLEEGELSGTVESETGSQTYIFSGTHRDGEFQGTHAETTDGFMEPTGSMTLAVEGANQ